MIFGRLKPIEEKERTSRLAIRTFCMIGANASGTILVGLFFIVGRNQNPNGLPN